MSRRRRSGPNRPRIQCRRPAILNHRRFTGPWCRNAAVLASAFAGSYLAPRSERPLESGLISGPVRTDRLVSRIDIGTWHAITGLIFNRRGARSRMFERSPMRRGLFKAGAAATVALSLPSVLRAQSAKSLRPIDLWRRYRFSRCGAALHQRIRAGRQGIHSPAERLKS